MIGIDGRQKLQTSTARAPARPGGRLLGDGTRGAPWTSVQDAMATRETTPRDAGPTVTETLDRVVDAAQGVVTDQLQLFRLEARVAVQSAVRGGVLLAAAAVLLAIGWVVILIATYGVLAPQTGGTNALWLLAGANVLLGLVLMGVARRSGPLEEAHG